MAVFEVRIIPSTRNRPDGPNEWGGSALELQLADPGQPFFNWLVCGEEFVVKLHRATGAYLAKKARDGAE